MKENLGTTLMKENFMRLHTEGKSIQEIAETYKVSIHTIYDSLQEIADKNGVTRESLLKRAHKKHLLINGRQNVTYETVDQSKLLKDFDDINTSISNILTTISTVLEEDN